MTQNEKTRELLIEHYKSYPRLKTEDIFKFLHQSAFGCEHAVTDCDAAALYISREAEGMRDMCPCVVEKLDGGYSRVHLGVIKEGMSAKTLAKLFCMSAKHEEDGISSLKQKLSVFTELVLEGDTPFDYDATIAAIAEWEQSDWGALHHSSEYRLAYSPAYRVISNEFVPFLPLFAKIDTCLEKGRVILAIDGGSASGKTSLSTILGSIYDCSVLHMDDFFLRPEQRTFERINEPGGNIDRERFLKEVLVPLSRAETISYRRFDCSLSKLSPSVSLHPKKLTVIEGVYSMHPCFADYYDLSVFLDVSPNLQKRRVQKRNSPEMAKRFFEEWIPLEHTYFNELQIKGKCDFCIEAVHSDVGQTQMI